MKIQVQFERTLIIVDEGASVHYVEGCTAPTYSSNSLHAAIVEIFALDGAYMRYRPSKTGLTMSTTWSPSGPKLKRCHS